MDDDDDGFNIMWITKNRVINKYLNYIYFYIDS
jgi:hypothetical protein